MMLDPFVRSIVDFLREWAEAIQLILSFKIEVSTVVLAKKKLWLHPKLVVFLGAQSNV